MEKFEAWLEPGARTGTVPFLLGRDEERRAHRILRRLHRAEVELGAVSRTLTSARPLSLRLHELLKLLKRVQCISSVPEGRVGP